MSAMKKDGQRRIGRAPKSSDEEIAAHLEKHFSESGREPSLTDLQAKFGGGTSRLVRLRRQWRAQRTLTSAARSADTHDPLAPLLSDIASQRASLAELRNDVAQLRASLSKRGTSSHGSASGGAAAEPAAEPPLVVGARALADMVVARLATTEQIQTLLLLLLGRVLDRDLATANSPARRPNPSKTGGGQSHTQKRARS